MGAILTLIPMPKKMRYNGMLELDKSYTITVETDTSASTVTQVASRQLIAWFAKHWQGTVLVCQSDGNRDERVESEPVYRIRLEDTKEESETYSLVAVSKELRIFGSPVGLLHGVQTLIQLLQPRASSNLLSVPLVEIEDTPDMAIRGFFAESYWGSDRMELSDWKSMIDDMVSFKLNTLGIGIYGCWPHGHCYPTDTNSLSEFLFAPVLDDPEQLQERQIHYFDPVAKQLTTKTYQAPIYEGDGLEQLIAYATERGIRVVPQFNGPGHSSLLPRLYPNISSVNEQGEPTYKGYSLTHPDTFPTLKRLLGRIVERYMLPYGQTWFHIGMDEIEEWSAADLAVYSKRQLFELYMLEISQYLLSSGMEKIIIWHDMAKNLTELDASFEVFLEQHGLSGKVAIHWWDYTMPICPVRAVRGAEGWTAPSTGWLPWMIYQDHVENIENRINEGMEHSFQGVMSYHVYSPNYRRNVASLAEKGWNAQRRDAAEFDRLYANWIVADEPQRWAKGMGDMRKLFEYSSTFALLMEIGVLFGQPKKAHLYPEPIIRSILSTDGTHKAYRITRTLAHNILPLFEQGKAVAGREYELQVIRFECRRVIALIDALLGLADAVQALEDTQNSPVEKRNELVADIGAQLQLELDKLDAFLIEVQDILPDYLVAVSWREYMYLREAMRKQVEQLTNLNDRFIHSEEK
ncbi:family 20 glycosylhydrolase [Paenibacillus sp. IITD108]